ncbi:MAG: hypothetical protein HY675_11290 [Chloroflexi bacterium]|nr:hypothetical protein [Chloroflexota bacterium]
MAGKIGEVIEVSTTELVAQCYELHQAPDFGSFVRVSDGSADIYAIVCHASTSGIDPGRRPVARGKDEVDEDDIFRNNPELPELLRTEFSAAIVGFVEDGLVRQYLPPRPPRLHSFVHTCSLAEAKAFSQQLDFLQTLVTANLRVPADELIAACIRQAGLAHQGDRTFLVRAGKELATLLVNDINRLNGILRRIGR